MKKINLISIGLFIIMVNFIQGCECEEPECYGSPPFFFKIIDITTGKDYIYDLDNPISKIKFLSGTLNTPILSHEDFAGGDNIPYLAAYVSAPETNYTIVIDTLELPINIELTSIKSKCCTDPNYEINGAKIANKSLEIETGSPSIYIIKI